MLPMILMFKQKLINVLMLEGVSLSQPDLIPVSFEDLEESTFKEQFRFSKEDIAEIVAKLHLPELFKLENNRQIEAKLGLSIYLRKLAYPCRLCNLEEKFGIDRTIISRVLKYINSFFKNNCMHLLEIRKCICNLKREQWTQAIHSKGAPLTTCFGFIDGTTRPRSIVVKVSYILSFMNSNYTVNAPLAW